MSQKLSTVDFSFVLASSVHDMKNSVGMLLNTLSGVTHQYPARDQKQANAYAVLEYEATRINAELIQLLSLYRIEQEQISVNIEKYCVIEVLEDQIARNDMLLKIRNISLELYCDEHLKGYFDADLIAGVINNLLVNAIQHCKSKIRISAEISGNGVVITINDDGDGYPDEVISAFNHGDAKISFSGGRPHLGLLFAHKVALMHSSNGQQGIIQVDNNGVLGGGCFRIILP